MAPLKSSIGNVARDQCQSSRCSDGEDLLSIDGVESSGFVCQDNRPSLDNLKFAESNAESFSAGKILILSLAQCALASPVYRSIWTQLCDQDYSVEVVTVEENETFSWKTRRPDLIIIDTDKVDEASMSQIQDLLIAFDANFIPAVILTQKALLPQSLNQLKQAGVLDCWWDVPNTDLDRVLRTLENYVALGRRIQALRQSESQLQADVQEHDRALRRHHTIQAAMRQEQKALERLVYLDGLTQIPNRRYLDITLTQEWQRSQREQQPLALILCDIDYFKRYNDALGHPSGDRCLQQVAKALTRAVKRPSDFVARYGGEEFVVLLPNTRLKGAMRVAQSLHRAMSAMALFHPDSPIDTHLTISLGVSCLMPYQASATPETLLNAADEALYKAKLLGRNCTAAGPSRSSSTVLDSSACLPFPSS